MELSKIRKKIDKIDYKLIKILSGRKEFVKDIVKYKQKNNIPIVQERRMKDMLQKRRSLARKMDLSPDFVGCLFLEILDESIKIQKEDPGKK